MLSRKIIEADEKAIIEQGNFNQYIIYVVTIFILSIGAGCAWYFDAPMAFQFAAVITIVFAITENFAQVNVYSYNTYRFLKMKEMEESSET